MNPWVNLTQPCTIHIEGVSKLHKKVWGTWGNLGVFFDAAQKIWAFWSIPEKMFSRMLKNLGA